MWYCLPLCAFLSLGSSRLDRATIDTEGLEITVCD